jgi:hypothetical protein
VFWFVKMDWPELSGVEPSATRPPVMRPFSGTSFQESASFVSVVTLMPLAVVSGLHLRPLTEADVSSRK